MECGSADVVEAVVRAGADVNEAVRTETPLHVAVEAGDVSVVARLLALGADVRARRGACAYSPPCTRLVFSVTHTHDGAIFNNSKVTVRKFIIV